MTLKLFKSGALVSMEKAGGMYTVLLRAPDGNVADKVRCDDYRNAMAYRRAFIKIARSL